MTDSENNFPPLFPSLIMRLVLSLPSLPSELEGKRSVYRTSIPRFPKRQRETRHMSLDAVGLPRSCSHRKISIETNHARCTATPTSARGGICD